MRLEIFAEVTLLYAYAFTFKVLTCSFLYVISLIEKEVGQRGNILKMDKRIRQLALK